MSKTKLHKTLLAIFCTVMVNLCYSQTQNRLREIESFGDNPGNLRMMVHEIPKDSVKRPLVVVLHGCSQNAKSIARLSGWNKLSDNHYFTVLYPQQKFINNPQLCFNWFNTDDIEKGKGECYSIYNMIQYLIINNNIDTNRIFITGLSAGASMSVVMAAMYPTLFENVAVFAGGAYKIATSPGQALGAMLGNGQISRAELITNVTNQNPNYTGKYPEMIIYHGTKDAVVDYSNAMLLIQQWTGINNTDTVPDVVVQNSASNPNITKYIYVDSIYEPVVNFFSVKNLGHQLLIDPGDNGWQGGKSGIWGVDWNYHSTYHTAAYFGLVR